MSGVRSVVVMVGLLGCNGGKDGPTPTPEPAEYSRVATHPQGDGFTAVTLPTLHDPSTATTRSSTPSASTPRTPTPAATIRSPSGTGWARR